MKNLVQVKKSQEPIILGEIEPDWAQGEMIEDLKVLYGINPGPHLKLRRGYINLLENLQIWDTPIEEIRVKRGWLPIPAEFKNEVIFNNGMTFKLEEVP